MRIDLIAPNGNYFPVWVEGVRYLSNGASSRNLCPHMERWVKCDWCNGDATPEQVRVMEQVEGVATLEALFGWLD